MQHCDTTCLAIMIQAIFFIFYVIEDNGALYFLEMMNIIPTCYMPIGAENVYKSRKTLTPLKTQ